MNRIVNSLLCTVATATMIYGSITGTVSLTDDMGVSKKSFSNGETLFITVEDSDLNTLVDVVESTTVALTSETETNAETVVLQETGVNTGIFKGTIGLQEGSALHNDVILQAQKGDTLSCLYNDASDDWGNSIETTEKTLFGLTSVSGTIEKNLHWTKKESPYLISGAVKLDSGYTLSVDPGVTVFAADTSTELYIKGKMQAIGTVDDSICFTSLDEFRGAWKGLKLTNAQLQYVSIKNAETGIFWKPSYDTPTSMKLSSIENSKKTPLRIESSGSDLSIENSYLASAEHGPMLIGIYAKSKIAFKHCKLSSPFFNSSSTSNILFYGNTLNGNYDFFNGSTSNMQFIGNTINGKIIAGQEYHTGELIIKGNNFTKYGELEYTGGPTTVEVKNNNFHGDREFLLTMKTVKDLDARFNYWGDSTTKEILDGANPKNLSLICDKYDKYYLGSVNYSNWLTEEFEITPMTIKKDIEDQLVPEGGEVKFVVEVSGGYGDLQYQWYKDNILIPGATGTSLTFTASELDTSRHFSCKITDDVTTIQSSAAKYSLLSPLVIVSQPSHISVYENSFATFSVEPGGGSGSYTYQWYYGNSAISGANGKSYSFTATASDTSKHFACEVTDGGAQVKSDGAYLYFIQKKKDTTINNSTTINIHGDTVVTTVETITTTITYPKHDKESSINNPPTINSTPVITANEDVEWSYTVLASDPETETLTYEISGQPSGMSITNNVIRWTPDEGQLSSGEVILTVSDDNIPVGAATQKFTISVTGVNDAPVLTTASSQTTAEETPLTITLAMTDATDVDNVLAETGIILGAGDNYTVAGQTITPALNFNGDLSVPVTVTDGALNSATVNMTVTVTPVNDAPTLTTVTAQTTAEETPLTVTLAMTDASDVDNVLTEAGIILGAGDNYTVVGQTITPAANFNGTFSVPVTVTDGELNSATVNMTVTVGAVNDAPVLTTATAQTTTEDTPLVLTVAMTDAVDPDGDALSLVIGAGDNYTVSGTTITPAVNFNGALMVSFAVTDGSLNSATVNMTVTVTPVNDAPVLTTATAQVTKQETPVVLTVDMTDASDVDGDALTLIVGAGANYVVEGTTVTPVVGFVGTLTVPVTVTDGALNSATVNMTITVQPTVAIKESDEKATSVGAFAVAPNMITNESEAHFVIGEELSGEGRIFVLDHLGDIIDEQAVSVTDGGHYYWDLRNRNGVSVGSGMYLVILEMNGKILKRKIGIKK